METKSKLTGLTILVTAFVLFSGFALRNTGEDTPQPNPIVDHVASDLQGITIAITYDTNFTKSNITMPPSGNASDTGHYTNQKSLDHGYVRNACTGESVEKYVIPSTKITAVIKTKYEMGILERTDFVFTSDSLYIFNTVQNDSKQFISTLYILPSLESKYEFQNYLSGGNAACGVDKKFLLKILSFCEKHEIKY